MCIFIDVDLYTACSKEVNTCACIFAQHLLKFVTRMSCNSRRVGDQIITFKVVVPKTLTDKQRQVIEEYRRDEQEPAGAEPNSARHSY